MPQTVIAIILLQSWIYHFVKQRKINNKIKKLQNTKKYIEVENTLTDRRAVAAKRRTKSLDCDLYNLRR